MSAEVFDRTRSQGDRRRMARRRVESNSCDRTAQQSLKKWQRGYVDVEPEGQPTEELPTDTTRNIQQVLGAAATASGPRARIPEDADVVDLVVPQSHGNSAPDATTSARK